MQATHVVLNFLGAPLKSKKERGQNNFNNMLYLTQYTQKYYQFYMCSAF